MTGESFKCLRPGNMIEMDEKTYRVIEKDGMGRVKLHKMVCSFYDSHGYDDYDTFAEAEEAKQQAIDDADTEAEINRLEREEIDWRLDRDAEPFWMHYKDIEED